MSRLLHARVKLRPGDGDGQSLILFAILLPLLLLFLAFVVDVAKAFVDQRHLQNAADAAALASAQQLNGSPSGCTSINDCATTYVSLNSGPAGMQPCLDSAFAVDTTHIGSDPPNSPNCYQHPYVDGAGNSHPDQILVWLYQCADTYFGGVIGIDQYCESVRSVSKGNTSPLQTTVVSPGTTIPPLTITNYSTQTIVNNGTTTVVTLTTPVTIPGTTVGPSTQTNQVSTSFVTTSTFQQANAAMFASDMTCGSGHGITFDKNNATINGFIHSNGSITLTGNNNSIGGASYGQSSPGSCLPSGSTYGYTLLDASFNSPPAPTVPWPVPWPPAATVCAGVGATTTNLTGSYAGGTYCNLTANGTISVCNPPTSGHLTVVATFIVIPKTCNNTTWPTGNYQQTFPNGTFGLLFYATGTGSDALDLQSNGQTFPANALAQLFAPNGTIHIEKNNGADGFWQAKDIQIDFNNFSMNGFGPGGTPGTTTITTPTTIGVPTTIQGTTVGPQTTSTTALSTGTTPPSTTVNTSTTTTTVTGTTQGNSTTTVTTGTTTVIKLNE